MASIEKTRVIVEPNESYDGKILPTEQAEIDRSVKIKSGATVHGSVYGQTVSVRGGTVDGSVMAADSIRLNHGQVAGEVGTDGKVTATGTTVCGTVTAQRARLTDCIIYGNVVGSNVILENCVVIGIVTAETELAADDLLCYTFKTYGEATLSDTSVVLPQAIVEGQIQFASPVVVTGLGELETESAGLPSMDKNDLVTVGESSYLTLSPRILNLDAITDRLHELEQTLQRVVTATSSDEIPPVNEILRTLSVDENQYPDIID